MIEVVKLTSVVFTSLNCPVIVTNRTWKRHACMDQHSIVSLAISNVMNKLYRYVYFLGNGINRSKYIFNFWYSLGNSEFLILIIKNIL